MASDKTSLGDRMKGYENVTRFYLPRHTYTIVRVDGRAFHTLTKNAEKPFDREIVEAMNDVAIDLCDQIQGARFAYVQSDEVSVLATDFDTIQSEPWFSGNVQKIASVSASIATVAFNGFMNYGAMFDGRVFTIPDPVEVMNYFIWRQRDAVRNSIHMVARSEFSHKELQGLNGSALQEKLFQERGINWNDYDAGLKRGRIVERTEEPNGDVTWHGWKVKDAPNFVADRGDWLDEMVPKHGQ